MSPSRKLARLLVAALAAVALPTLATAQSSGAPSAPKPAHKSTAKSAAKSPAKSTAKPAVPAPVPKSPVTISITSRIRRGNLVVLLDDVAVFDEKFEKSPFVISQTTTWDPVQVAAGTHKLTAKVYDAKGKTYLSETYDLEVSRTKGMEVRVRLSGDKLTVEPSS